MTVTNSQDIARRIAYWRRRRGLTMRQFGDLVGRSVSWVEKVESGEREVVRLPMLELIAQALQINVRALIDDTDAQKAQESPDAAEIAAIKAALGQYETLISDRPGAQSPTIEGLRQRTEYANTAFLASDFAVVGRTLPDLIRDGQLAERRLSDEAGREAASLLVTIYKIASSTMHKFGSHDLAWLAADRAMSAALRASDPVSLARGTRCVARALMSVGQRREAIDLVRHMTARLEPELDQANPDLLSLVGMMWLAAEIAAAREGDHQTADEMHQQAAEVAARLGAHYDDPTTAFGIPNVRVHRLSALVRLGDGPAALRYAAKVQDADLNRLPRERKANYLLDLALAHRQCGDYIAAINALWDADQTSPQEVRSRPTTRELIAEIMQSERAASSPKLRLLAANAGLST